ncbi:MAG: hypothetical protein R3C32_06690 [Chloroflexota bacterium]
MLIEPLLDPVLVAAAHELGRVVLTPLPHDSPGPDFGPHEPGRARRPTRS